MYNVHVCTYNNKASYPLDIKITDEQEMYMLLKKLIIALITAHFGNLRG